MKKYKQLETAPPENFKQMTGMSKENFQTLCDKTESYIKEEKKRNPLKQRGLKTSKLSLADRVLLTLYYLRHYPTFINLAEIFNISESYCYKIYSRYSRILVKVETIPKLRKR
ncbi:MAG: transposase family protein [Candidatus Marithrix sp.]|nr:transposase family protein [Candidatus Marithrix sp.]